MSEEDDLRTDAQARIIGILSEADTAVLDAFTVIVEEMKLQEAEPQGGKQNLAHFLLHIQTLLYEANVQYTARLNGGTGPHLLRRMAAECIRAMLQHGVVTRSQEP